MKRGDFVDVTLEGRTVTAMVTLASPNERSLMVMFDGMFGGYLGMMPLFDRDGSGEYTDLVAGRPVTVVPKRLQ